MAGITSNIPKKIPFGKAISAKMPSWTSNPKISELAATYKAILDSGNACKECFIRAATISPEQISDWMLETDNVVLQHDINVMAYIDQDTYQLILDSFRDAKAAAENNNLTLTDSVGNLYNVYINDQYPTWIDGMETYVYSKAGDWLVPLVAIDNQGRYMFNNTLVTISGVRNSVYNLVGDIKNSLDVNKFLSDICTCLVNISNNTTTAVSSVIMSAIGSANQQISALGAQFLSVFSSGGIGNIIQAVADFIKAQASTTDQDGVLTMTDNSGLVPQVYIAGIIQGVVALATTAASLIAAMINPVLGLVTAAVGAVVNGIVAAFNTAHQNSYACINTVNDNSMVNMHAPFATWQCENISPDGFAWFQHGTTLRDWWVDNGYPLIKLDVPGGTLLLGKGSQFTTNAPKINMEFHPGLKKIFSNNTSGAGNKSRYFMRILGFPIAVCNYGGSWTSVSQNQVLFGFDTYSQTNYDDATDALNELIEEYEDAPYLEPDGTGEYYGYFKDNDLNVRRSLCYNTLLFLAWSTYQRLHEVIGRTTPFYLMSMVSNVGYTDSNTPPDGFGLKVTDANAVYWNSWAHGYGDLFIGLLYDKVLTDQTSSTSHYWNCRFYQGSFNSANYQGMKQFEIKIDPDTAFSVQRWRGIVEACSRVNDTIGIYHVQETNSSDGLVGLSGGDGAKCRPVYCYYGVPQSYLTNKCAIVTPTVDWEATVALFVLIAAFTVVVGIAAAVATVKVNKFIKYKRASNAAKVNKAWDDFEQDPSLSNYQVYKRTAFKNNMWAKIIGGNTYSKTDYWYGDSQQDDDGNFLNSTLLSYVTSDLYEDPNVKSIRELNTNVSDLSGDITTLESKINNIIKLISGINPED